jgi:hypothetical protein
MRGSTYTNPPLRPLNATNPLTDPGVGCPAERRSRHRIRGAPGSAWLTTSSWLATSPLRRRPCPSLVDEFGLRRVLAYQLDTSKYRGPGLVGPARGDGPAVRAHEVEAELPGAALAHDELRLRHRCSSRRGLLARPPRPDVRPARVNARATATTRDVAIRSAMTTAAALLASLATPLLLADAPSLALPPRHGSHCIARLLAWHEACGTGSDGCSRYEPLASSTSGAALSWILFGCRSR